MGPSHTQYGSPEVTGSVFAGTDAALIKSAVSHGFPRILTDTGATLPCTDANQSFESIQQTA